MDRTCFIDTKRWSMLFIYNFYRLICILILFIIFWVNAAGYKSFTWDLIGLIGYFFTGLFLFYFSFSHWLDFKKQVLWSGTIDIVLMGFFIHLTGYMQSGLGILLNALVALLSILITGRLAIFFAAIASCLLLTISIIQYQQNISESLAIFFSTGIYGAGFFCHCLDSLVFR